MLRVPQARSAIVVVFAIALALVLPVFPATAATAKPAKVGLVTFTGATTTSLTVDWSSVGGADEYYVYWATSHSAVVSPKRAYRKVAASQTTITGLKPGVAYYVQARAVRDGVMGDRSAPSAHETITAQASFPAGAAQYRALTWNICSNACSGISSRARVINSRIGELKPDVVAMQEASRYTKAPTGYRHVVNGQNDILVRSGSFSLVGKNKAGATTGTARFSSKYAGSGKGLAWAALKHRSGAYVLVVNAHLTVGGSSSQIKQREYEAGRLPSFVRSTLAKLAASHGGLTNWKNAPVIVLGDLNTHKSRRTERTQQILEDLGWHDAYDQARGLSGQHRNSAIPGMSSTPVIGVTWGDHVDKVLVRPSRTVVYGWANGGKMSGSKYAMPLGSDHQPVVVRLSVK